MVVRVTRNGCLANARPCRKCVRMMKDLRVKRVFYSSGKDSEIVCENVRDILVFKIVHREDIFQELNLIYQRMILSTINIY